MDPALNSWLRVERRSCRAVRAAASFPSPGAAARRHPRSKGPVGVDAEEVLTIVCVDCLGVSHPDRSDSGQEHGDVRSFLDRPAGVPVQRGSDTQARHTGVRLASLTTLKTAEPSRIPAPSPSARCAPPTGKPSTSPGMSGRTSAMLRQCTNRQPVFPPGTTECHRVGPETRSVRHSRPDLIHTAHLRTLIQHPGPGAGQARTHTQPTSPTHGGRGVQSSTPTTPTCHVECSSPGSDFRPFGVRTLGGTGGGESGVPVACLEVGQEIVLARDGFACQIRLPACRRRPDTVDHVVELDEGGALYALSNLQAACRSCNTAKRNRSLSQRAKRARVQRRNW
jgi:HNH endonuclease